MVSKFVEVSVLDDEVSDMHTLMKEVVPLFPDTEKGRQAKKEFGERYVELEGQDSDEDSDEDEDEGKTKVDDAKLEMFKLLIDKKYDLFGLIYNGKKPNGAKVLEIYFTILMSMFEGMNGVESVEFAVGLMLELLTKHSAVGIDMQRLRFLMLMYNILPKGHETFGGLNHTIFMNIIEFAGERNLFEEMVPYLSSLDAWIAEWKMKDNAEAKAREVYFAVAKKMAAIKSKNADFLEYTFEWLRKFLQSESTDTLASGSDAAKSQLLEAIKMLAVEVVELPSIYEVDELLRIPVLAAAKAKDAAKSGVLVELIELFKTGTIKEFSAYYPKNKAFLDGECGLTEESLLKKFRVLTLASICENRTEIPIAEIKQALAIESGIEDVILNAIFFGVATGKIDELRQVFIVKSVLKRNFGKQDWAALDSSIEKWIQKIEVLKGMYVN